MKGSIGLIIYVVVAIISSVLKKRAQENAKQRRNLIGPENIDPYQVTLEDMLEDRSDAFATVSGFDTGLEVDLEDQRDAGEIQGERINRPSENAKVAPTRRAAPQSLNLAQAILMSEIIREPRAKRPWPSR